MVALMLECPQIVKLGKSLKFVDKQAWFSTIIRMLWDGSLIYFLLDGLFAFEDILDCY